MHKQKKEIIIKIVISFSVLWMLICPEIYLQDDFSCIERIDGKEITTEEASTLWQDFIMNEDESSEVTYKLKIVDWLEEQGYKIF